MPFYTYHQNNSGGFYKGPAQYVVVEAANAEDADRVAEENGVYFGGLGDCQCCGARWGRAWESDATAQPECYGEPAEKFWLKQKVRDDVRVGVLLFANGEIRTV